jgi:hypothetical protein
VHLMKRELDARQSGAVPGKVTKYEESVGLLCFGVFLIGLAVFIWFRAPDLGETFARSGLPMWAFIALLALAGVGMIVLGGVKLLLGHSRKK